MHNLFLVDGAAGTGKTDMLDYLREKYSDRKQVAVILKYTTREHRAEEIKRKLSLDLEFVTQRKFADLKRNDDFYSYEYGGALYGFSKSAIDRALKTHSHVFAIVRDRATIEHVVNDYPRICTIPVFIYTDREECERRLQADDYDEDAVRFRLARQKLAWDDYLRHSELYREVIINNSNKTDFHRLIDYLVHKYSPEHDPLNTLVISNCERFDLLKPLVGFKNAIQSRTQNYERNVFLMMKFRDSNKLLSKVIKKELEGIGLNCVRADESEWKITHNVYNPLAVLYCCKYGIALFDEPEKRNFFSPNVAYELGMMHLQGKQCLILRHKSLPEMPFDLIKDIHHTYSKDLEVPEIVRNWASAIRD
jgi:guanylate kinase